MTDTPDKELDIRMKAGHPRIYANDKERQKAYYERVKAKKELLKPVAPSDQLPLLLESKLRGTSFTPRFNPLKKWCYDILGRDTLQSLCQGGIIFHEFSPKQLAFLGYFIDPKKWCVMGLGGRGSTKTSSAGVGCAYLLWHLPKFKISVISGSKDQARIIYHDYLVPILESHCFEGYVTKSIQSLTEFETGSWIRILPATEKATRGSRADLVVIEEVCQCPDEIIKTIMPQAITAKNMMVRITGTPDKWNHPVKKWWDDAAKYDITTVQWSVMDCPWIPKENVERLKLVYNESEIQIEIHGKWAQRMGHIISEGHINRALAMKKPETFTKVLLGVDWGVTKTHPAAITVLGFGHLGDKDVRYVIESIEYVEKSWDYVRSEILRLAEYYSAKVWTESTQFGSAVHDDLRTNLKKEGLSYDHRAFQGGGGSTIPNSNKGKRGFVQAICHDFENGTVGIDTEKCKPFVDELHGWAMGEDELPVKGNDDNIDSYMICRGTNLTETKKKLFMRWL